MYLNLFYGDFNRDPMTLVNAIKGNIAGKYINKIKASVPVEHAMKDLLDIDIGDIITSSKEAQQGVQLVNDINVLMSQLRNIESKFRNNSDYIYILNAHVNSLMERVMNYATSIGGYTQDSIRQLERAQLSLEELENRIKTQSTSFGHVKAKKKNKTESSILNILDGIFNNVRGALGELANIAGLVSALSRGNKEFLAVNVGGTSGISGLGKQTNDPKLQIESARLERALASLSTQSKEDVHLMVQMNENGGNVQANWMHVGFSSKIAKGNKVHIQNTTLNAMLNTAYPGSLEFLFNLAAGVASDSDTAQTKNLKPPGHWTNAILQDAWKETITNAYKLLLADYIAGDYSNIGSSVNYLIINKEVFPISQVLIQVFMDNSLADLSFVENKFVLTRSTFVAEQWKAYQSSPEERQQRSEQVMTNIQQKWQSAKISISLNYSLLKGI